MSVPAYLGEFEQLVLLAILQLGEEARAAVVRARIEEVATRRVTRGSLYATIDRLAGKGLLDWVVEDGGPERGGVPHRRFRVTEAGREAVRHSYSVIQELSRGLGGVLGS
ncbi:MAG: helix-turn-helix transcriptional regulator [Gemmatimonadota bacterium]|jgi:DNA-binding PadR family transcriptional regulator